MRSAEQSGVEARGFGVRDGRQFGPDMASSEGWQLAEMLLAAMAGAGRAPKAHTDFPALLAQMSHEIRTPLNHIIGFAALMVAETHGPLGDRRYAEYVEHIRCSGEQLLASFAAVLTELERAQGLPARRQAVAEQALGSTPAARPAPRPPQTDLWRRAGRG